MSASNWSADAREIEISDTTRLSPAPVVSVLMLTYNHGDYLAEAIEGVIRQNVNFPIELVIGEDCSTDNTREIALRYQREHPDIIRLVMGDSNLGARRNRLRSSRRLRGEFIAFCEGDDYWTDPTKLQRQVEYLRAHSNVGAIHTDFDHILFRGGGWRRLSNFQQHRYPGTQPPQGSIFPALLRGNFIQTCTLCVRTDVDRAFLEGGFLKDSYLVGDWPLCLYVATRHKIAFLPESTATYRVVPGSMMNSKPATMIKIVASYLAIVEDFCDMRHVEEGERIAALVPHYRRLWSLAVFASDIGLFDRVCEWLRQNDPNFIKPWRRQLLPKIVRYALVRELLSQIQRLRERLKSQHGYT